MITIDEDRHEIYVGEGEVRRTIVPPPKEFALLVILGRANGSVLGRERLMEDIWPDSDVDSRTVDQHVARLRSKLKTAARCVVTVPNHGYKAVGVSFTVPPTAIVGRVADLSRRIIAGRMRTRFYVDVDGPAEKVRKGDPVRLA